MAIKIITDSACDLPGYVTDEFGIEVIPTPVIIDGVDYFDGETIQPESFYDILTEGEKTISTYHINMSMFMDHFEPYAKRGDELIYICFSTGIAGTFNAANQAKNELLETYPDFDLTIIDSKCASAGFGLVVLYAGMLYRAGADKAKLIEATEYHAAHMNHVFTVDTLTYLMKGGRISRTSAIAGEMLSIRPIITVDENGSLFAKEKVHGRKKLLARLAELTGELGKGLDRQVIGLVYGNNPDTRDEVEEKLRAQYGVKHIQESRVGCAIGAHTGPGMVGITFLDEPSPYITEQNYYLPGESVRG